MAGPHEDVEKENACLRREVQLLREERDVLKLRRLKIDPVDQL
jgi:transposase